MTMSSHDTSLRFRLPARQRLPARVGCGFRRRTDLASAAYVSCFIESAEVFLDRRNASGALVPDIGPSLTPHHLWSWLGLLTTAGPASMTSRGERVH